MLNGQKRHFKIEIPPPFSAAIGSGTRRQTDQRVLLLPHALTHSPVVGHDKRAEEAVDDGERHDQRVETVAQLLSEESRKNNTWQINEFF